MARPLRIAAFLRAADVALTPAFKPFPELYQMAEKGHGPMLQRDQRMIERSPLTVTAAEKEYPNPISVGFMYQQRPDSRRGNSQVTRQRTRLLPQQAKGRNQAG